MNDDWVVKRRKLPHVDKAGRPTFITGCLHGSLSSVGLQQIRTRRDELERQSKPADVSAQDWEIIKHKLLFKFVDSLLDGKAPVTHLKDDRLAKVVQDAFLHFADERYHLFAFAVMPSHHHWVFLPTEEWEIKMAIQYADSAKAKTPREVISHSIQSFTATQCNRILGASGSFWQTETFDHYARNDDELFRIINYIEQNPVATGLVSNAEDYPWSSARIRQRLGIQPGEAIPKKVG